MAASRSDDVSFSAARGIALLAQRLNGHVLAVGDLMLDVFHYGTISRISPEAPVPVMHLRHEDRMVGGVGNVARNIAALHGRVTVVAPIGDDAAGRNISAMLSEGNIQSRLVPCSGRPTSVKRRFVAAGQQVLRADREDVDPISPEAETELLNIVECAIGNCGALILSDYGKGALTPRITTRCIALAKRAGVPVLVDPKGRDYTDYAGAFCVTPNLAELELVTGRSAQTDDDLQAAAHMLIGRTGIDYLLITRSEKGMSLAARDAGDVIHVPAHKREVFDVSGAGDTVIATLALCVASGASILEGAHLANVAAGFVVSKRGTATCTLAELEDELNHLQADPFSKVRPISTALHIAEQWRSLDLKIGFTNGCFDIVHPGHIHLLQRSRARCDRLIVGMNTDASIKRLKGPDRPVQSELARATVLAALACVDMVIFFDQDTPLDLIGALRPDVLLKGADYTVETVVGSDIVLRSGGEVLLIDLVEDMSTTSIIGRMGR